VDEVEDEVEMHSWREEGRWPRRVVGMQWWTRRIESINDDKCATRSTRYLPGAVSQSDMMGVMSVDS